MTRPEPTIREIIATLRDEGELTGFTDQMKHDARWTPEVENLIEMRRAELRRPK